MFIESTKAIKDLRNLKFALDQASIVAITDAAGIITFVNEKFCSISKYSRGELIGKNHRILKSGYHSEKFYKELWRDISSGKVWHGSIKNKAKDGSIYWVHTTIVPFFDEDDKISEYISIRTDITKEKENLAKMLTMEKLSGIGTLSARIAHDLRNPLHVINSGMQIIEMKNKDIAKSEDMKRIQRAIKRMTNQLDGVLDFVKSSDLYIRDTSIQKCFINATSTIVIPKNIKLTISQKECIIRADYEKLEIVFANLIRNSVESIGLTNGEIKIEINDDDDAITIIFTDTGPDIPHEEISKVFEPLYSTKQTGTGLGLVSCKTIIEQHGGSISVSVMPKTFTVKLPKKIIV